MENWRTTFQSFYIIYFIILRFVSSLFAILIFLMSVEIAQILSRFMQQFK
jgi:hypothetical protein